MIDKDPMTWSIATWMLAIGMGIGGGIASFIRKVRLGHSHKFNLTELMGEIFISGFVSVIVFMALTSRNIDVSMSAAISGASGHMSTRLLFMIESLIEMRFNKAMHITKND